MTPTMPVITPKDRLQADRAQIGAFVKSLFRYAEPGTYVALRAFEQRGKKTVARAAVQVNGDLSKIADAAAGMAERVANGAPAVFCPPICTLANDQRVRTEDLANGLCLSVEIDEGDTAAARNRLEGLLGPATAVVASGSEWTNPKTGELHPKVHLHWRLDEPTTDAEDHARLRQARDMAARLVGADPTGKPVVHPLRWPGSWNVKGKPKLARLLALNEEAEISLGDALDRLQEAVEATGWAEAELPRSSDPQAAVPLLQAAMRAIPNAGAEVHYDFWILLGYASYRAAGGEAGFDMWDDWSRKSDKYNGTEQEAAWKRIRSAIAGSSAPRTVGAGTIFFHAKAAGWTRPRPTQDEPPDLPDDPGYAASVAADAKGKAKAKAPVADADLVTEDTVALAFADAHKDELRFDHSADKWFHWNGTTWRQEKTKLAYAWARDLARDLATESDNFKAQLSAGKASFASGVERMARTDRRFAITSELWNPDPFLLGTPAGTVDLHTGELRASRQSDHITKQTAVAPAETADCPTWLKFLRETTRNDEQLIGFLQRWFGYTLTGDTREHALLFAWGPGGNGKGVLMNTVSGILAEYATTAAMDTFVTSYGSKHTTDLAMLAGARMVMTTEVDEGQTWAEQKLKALTGGDPITARFMRQDNFTFLPTFKLTVSGNHKPSLNTVDDAIRRRLNLAPFLYKPAKPDTTLPKRLVREWPGILRWLIDGCLEWQQFGLNPPKAVLDATKDYFEAQDFYGRWLAECCKIHPGLEERPGNLLRSFQAWCAENGETFADNKKLRGMLERTPGIRYGASKGKNVVRGIGLNAAADPRQQPDD